MNDVSVVDCGNISPFGGDRQGDTISPPKAIRINEDVLLLESAGGDLVKERRSAIVEVLSPPIEIITLAVGDMVRRPPHKFQCQYIPAVLTATVERISVNGVWVRTDQPESKVYHVSDVAFDEGWWERITDD